MNITTSVLGKNGRYFSVYVLMVASLFFFGALFAWSGVFVGYQAAGFFLICIASMLCLYWGLIGFQTVQILKRTVKMIRVEDDVIRCRTFDNRIVIMPLTSMSKMGRRNFPLLLKNLLFPERVAHYSIVSGKYFISGIMENLESILPNSALSMFTEPSYQSDSIV